MITSKFTYVNIIKPPSFWFAQTFIRGCIQRGWRTVITGEKGCIFSVKSDFSEHDCNEFVNKPREISSGEERFTTPQTNKHIFPAAMTRECTFKKGFSLLQKGIYHAQIDCRTVQDGGIICCDDNCAIFITEPEEKEQTEFG